MRSVHFLVMLTAAAAVSTGGAAYAHHAVNAAFQAEKFVTIQGEFVKVQLVNPHSLFQFKVTGANGQPAVWDIESSSVTALRRAGLTGRSTFKVGDKFDMVINPSRDGSNRGFLRVLTFADGRKVNLGAEVGDRPLQRPQ